MRNSETHELAEKSSPSAQSLHRRDVIFQAAAVGTVGAGALAMPLRAVSASVGASHWNQLEGDEFQLVAKTFRGQKQTGRLILIEVTETDYSEDRARPIELGRKSLSLMFRSLGGDALPSATYRLHNRRLGAIDLLLTETRQHKSLQPVYEAIIN